VIALSIDTCVGFGSLSVFRNDELIGEKLELRSPAGGSDLAMHVNATIEQLGLKWNEIEKIVVTRGPGSFTGVRTGLSFVRGALTGRIIELETCLATEAMSATCPAARRTISVILFAGRTEAAVQHFNRVGRAGGDELRGDLEILTYAQLPDIFSSGAYCIVAEKRAFDAIPPGIAKEIISSGNDLFVSPENISRLAYTFVSARKSKSCSLDAVYTREFVAGGK